MASITVDIQAKVVGYEASLKAMKDAFSKIDPGSDIGKSLEKAIKYAESQLKNLNKNLTPKASSDTQIDSIIEKTNRAGEAIQEVSALMQKVTFGDIDFSNFENGISNLMSTLRDLESELDSRVSKGLQETIANSSELINSFSKLDIDVKDKSAGQIFEAVSEKAKKAAEDTEAARVKLEAAQKNLNSQQGKLNQLESNPIYNKDVLEQDLQNIAVEYTKTFDEIKNKIQEGLRGLLGSDSVQADKLMENFMNGLNPQTLKDHLMQLKNELQQELSENNSAKDIYTALLGDAGQSGNAQAITTKLLSGLNQSLPQLKEELQNKVQDFISSLTNKEAGQITTLISLGDIEKAVKTTIQAVERAYDSVKGAVAKKRADVVSALKGQETAQTDFDTAQQNQQYIEGIQANLQQQIDDLKKENSTLQERIDQLVKQIQEKKDIEEKSIHKTAVDSGSKAGNLKVSADEARMYRTELEQVQAKEKLIGKIEGVVQRWFSIYAAVRMVGNAIRSVISTVKELDKTITEIAIVTNMTQNELWGQMKSYTDMARQYAASISGVYKVSQLYYQQGLQTADVMALTEQTLKMARISGLDYAQATDYMTNAVRSFKMEMTDAQRVVDVYSEIAASSATSTSELASAMSKTASSAAAVGASFENTTAMMAVMIEATREAPENIGSAMKSIISRYGEMKADPSKLIDSEGQEMSLNKVDKALQSVGISIQDTNHQFRDFDDVITELASKWDTIDKNTQRYIATIMAGNRQQSRFLALVSNGERLAELSEKAANSEDTATLQVLKTMDSIEAKSQQLKTSLQSLYTSTGIQNLFKGFLDVGNQIVKTFTQMPTILGAPIPAILKIGTTFASLANVVTTVFGMIKAKTQAQIAALNGQESAQLQNSVIERTAIRQQEANSANAIMEQIVAYRKAFEEAITRNQNLEAEKRIEIAKQEAEAAKQAIIDKQTGANISSRGLTKKNAGQALGLNIAGVVLSTISGAISDKTQSSKFIKGATGVLGSTASMAGMGMMMSPGNPLLGAGIGAALGAVMGIVENINFLFESAEAKAQRLKEAATEANNTYLQKKEDYRSLDEQIKKLKELEKARYDSTEANEEYLQASNALASSYPELIGYIDQEGNAIVNLANDYDVLANARLTAQQAAIDAAEESTRQAENAYDTALKNRGKNRSNVTENWLNDQLTEQDLTKWAEIGVDTIELPANTRKNLLKNISQQFREKADSGDEQINNDYDLLAMINNLISDDQANLDFFNEQIEKEKENLQRIKSENPEDELIQAYFSLIENLTGNLLSVDQDISQKSNVVDATNRAAISNATYWASQAKLADEKENADFLKEFDTVNDIISSYINSQFEVFKKENTDEEGNFAEGETWYSKFRDATKGGLNQSYDVIYSQIQTLWNNLGTDIKQSDFNKLIANRDIYSENQFAEIIQEKYGITADSELGQSLLQYYNNTFDSEKFDNAIKARQDAGNELIIPWFTSFNGLLDSLSGSELQNILDVYDNIQKQIENKNISQDLGQSLLDKYFNIWNIMHEEQWDNEALEEAQALLLNADLFSLSGLDDFRKAVEKSSLNSDKQQTLVEVAEDFANLVPANLTVELQSFSQKVTSNIEDFEKAISNAAKGMDLKAATEMAQKLGKSLSDFDFKNGKFFFDDFATIRDAYLGENEQYKQDLEVAKNNLKTKYNKDTINKAMAAFSDIDIIDLFSRKMSLDTVKETLEGYSEGITNAGYDSETLLQYYQNYLNAIEEKTISSTTDFWTYLAQDFDNQYEEAVGISNKYANDSMARAALSIGDFTNFLKTKGIKSDWGINYYSNLLNNGEIDTILNRFPEYASDILKYYQDINKNVYDKLISGLDSQQYINTDEFNAETLQSLETAGLVEKISGEGSKAIYKTLDKMTNEQLDLFAQTVVNSNLIKADKDKMLASIHTEKYEDNIYEGLSGVADSFDKFSYEAGQKLANSLGTSVENLINTGIINVDEVTGDLSISYEQMRSYLASNMHNMTIKQYNELRAKLETKANKEDSAQIFNNIVQNRNKLSEENIAALGTILDKGYIAVTNMLQQNADGTYTLDLATIQQLINNGQVKINEGLKQLIANEIDTIISSLTGLGTLQNKGTTSIEDMQKRVATINQQLGQNFSMQDLFVYDEQLNAFVYSIQGLQVQAASLAAQLETLKSDTERNADEIWAVEQSMKNIAVQMANNIDFSSVLNLSIGDPSRNIKFDELRQAIEDYNTVLAEIGITTGLNTDNLIRSLRYGGENAVRAAEAIAKAQGKTLSAEDVEAAYRSQINNFTGAIDTLIAKPGEIVDTITASLINENGGKVEELGNTGQYVVQSAANLYEAYNDLLCRMAATGEATLADLNKVTALALENRDGEQQVIDALGDAAGMTFTRFGEILASAGINLSEQLIEILSSNGLISFKGGNKIAIEDFTAFANFMNWDADSEEYVSAFKSYNDSLIEMNRQAEHNILEEAKSLSEVQSGDWINLTQLSDILSKTKVFDDYGRALEDNQLESLNLTLSQYGASIENGILRIGENADILSIIQSVQITAENYGGLISSEMAELADAIADAIKGYADLINGAIEGSLSETQANFLQQFADSRGLGQLDFSRTANGLKVSEQSATKLYFEISKIDAIQGKLVFDSLRSSLEASNGQVANISKTTNTIINIQNRMRDNASEIAKLEKEGADQTKVNKIQAENRGLQQQLNLYKQIATAQSSDPEQFNFMNRSMPDSFQGPINYWDSIGKAFSVMNESAKTGKMGIQDFYNIVNEMSNQAQLSGQEIEFMGFKIDGSAENAAALIQKGFSALSNVDGSGVKIDLEKLGADISGGAANMAKGFDTGIKSMAQSQIKMLDAAINMLEAIVAMEDIDINSDNFLDFDEIFANGKDLSEGFTKPVEEWITKLETLSGGIEIGGKSFREALESLNPEEIQDLLNKLYSIDWTLGDTDVFGQIQNVLSAFFPGQSIIKGESIFDILKVPKNAEKDSKEFQQWLEDMSLNESQAKALLNAIENDTLNTHIDNSMGQALVKMLGVTKEQMATFKSFIGEEQKIDSSEIKMWSQIDIKVDEKSGEITGTYTASDGSSLTLSSDASNWKNEIEEYEAAIIVEKTSGGGVSKDTALSGKAHTETLNFPGGSYEIVVDESAGAPKFYGNFNGVPIGPCSSRTELAEEIKKLIAQQESGGEHYKLDENGDIQYDAEGNVIVEYSWHYEKGLTPEQKADVEKNASQLAGEIRKGTELQIGKDYEQSGDKIKIKSIPGIEFEASAITGEDGKIDNSKLLSALKTITGEDDSIGQSVAEGIKTALADIPGLGEAIGQAIQTALTGLSSGDLGEQEIPEINAKIAKLNITSVGSAAFGGGGLFGRALSTVSKILGGSNLTIPSADAKIDTLNITNAGTVDTSKMVSIGEQIAASLQEGLSLHPLTPTIDTSGSNGEDNEGEDKGSNGGKKRSTDAYNTPKPAAPETSQIDTSWATNLSTSMSQLAGAASIAAGGLAVAQHALDGVNTETISTVASALGSITSDAATTVKDTLENISNDAANTAKTTLEKIDSSNAKSAKEEINKINPYKAKRAKEEINEIDPGGASDARTAINNIQAPRSLSSKLSVTLSSAKGNMGNFAHAKGNVALAGGQNTLMGELGPELVVSNGRYFIVGQNGAEFVNLANDAIVFNHLQTRRLMEQGAIGGRGRPITNERTAVAFAKGKYPEVGHAHDPTGPADDTKTSEPQKVKSVKFYPTDFELNLLKGSLSSVGGFSSKTFAKGNIAGPAMASASAALAALKQLRAMWQSLLNASLKDMGGMPSGGGGGGGGGGGSDKTKEAAEGIANAAERWYNWLVLIEEIQNKINILQKEYSLLEKQNLSTDQKKENLLKRYNQLLDERATREQLSIEQQQYRTKLAEDANKGLFSAFYRVAPETGRVFYANDKAFIEYARKNKPSVDEKNLAWALANNGSIKANTTVKGTYSSEEATKKAGQVVKQSYGKSKVPQYLKDYYKKGKLIKGKEEAAKTAARKHWMEQEKTFTTKKTITTGKDFLEELNATNKAGNLIHNAAEQLALIKRMGIYSDDLEAGVDKKQDGWEATVVQNFFDKIDNDKAEIEALNKSIQEQEEGSKEAAIAMQEINDELRDLYKPITGVTEGLDEWYNVLRKLTDLQNQYNLVTKKATVLEKENIINGTEQYKNLKEQAKLLKEQQKVNNEIFNTRFQKSKELEKNAGGLEKFFSIDKNTGSAAFNKVLSKTITYKTSDKVATTTRNGRTYEVDEEGRYIDENGIIHDNNGRVLKDGEFGKLKIQEGINRTETFSGDIVEILEKLTAQDVTGKTAYNADEQYQILKSLGLEKFMQYDEKGGQIYSQFGEMTKEEQQKAVEAGIKRLQSYVEDINSNNDEIAKLEQENVDLTSSLLDIENKIRDLNIDIENQMHEAIVQDRQNEIDTRTEIKDALKDAADKTVEGLKESLEKEKQISQSKQDENDLIKIQNQLNLLRSAGGSNSKIRELELQAQKKQQDIYFNEREQTINAIEEASNKQIEALETQIDIMQTSLDVQVKYGLLWDEVNSKLNNWNIPEIVNYIAQNNGILSKNLEERDKLYNELASKIGVIAAAVGDKQGIDTASSDTISRDQFLNKELNNYGDLSESYRNYLLEQGRKAYDSNKELTEKERQAKAKESINKAREKVAGNVSKLSSSIEEAKRATGKKYEDTTSLFNEAKAKYESGSSESEVKDYINKNLSKYEKQEIKTPEPKVETKTIETSQQDKETTQPQQQQSQNEKSQVDKQENKEAASKTTSSVILTTTKKGLPRFIAPERNYKQAQNNKAKMKKGTKLKVIGIQAAGKETYITKNSGKRPMLKIDYNGKIRYVPYWYGYFPEGKKGVASLRAKLPTFKQGGAIDFTGPAWVDGTKEKPEQIFNYEQMEALREYMLNSVNTTKLAIAGLNSILDNLPDSATYNSINNTNSGITIDNLEFHMEVKEISNDYDARRAGQEAMAEMVRIARKTGNRSITRR